ncbi:MAG: pyridoxamine 5'-phosphate oxidase family protein [Pseudomonadales bacterium]|nr:pyridoxamine 5'-phosphate oxidase family protein [Pseudomonadales bacterium]
MNEKQMTRWLTILFACSVAVGLAPVNAATNNTAGHHAMSDEDRALLDLARTTIVDARYCAMITVDKKGQPRARTVDPFLPDDNFNILIATRPNTRKVEQIKGNSQVTLYYFDAENRNYVTVMGIATLIEEVGMKRAMRRERDNARLYPNFPDDYLLIHVSPSWVEAMVPGYRGDRETWRPSAVTFAGQ